MSRTRRFLGGVGFGYANQLLVMLTGLWLTPFLLGRVGPHDYGLWLVGAQVLAYLMLLDLGVVALLPREAATLTGRAGHDAEELRTLTGQTARLVLWQTPLMMAAAAAVYFLLPSPWEALRAPLAGLLAVVAVTFPLRVLPAALQGLQDLQFLAQLSICAWGAGFLLTVGLVVAGVGLPALAAGWALVHCLTIAASFVRLRQRFPHALPRGLPRFTREEARRKLASGFWVSVTQVAVVLLYGTDVLIIGKLLGPAAVVPYACTVKLVQVLSNQPQMLTQVAIPALSELRAGGAGEDLRRVCVALTQAMLILSGGVFCVVLATNEGFVGWWVGPGQFGGLLLTALVLANMLVRHWNLTLACVLFAFGGERRLAVVALLDGLVTVGAMVALTPLYGLTGAAAGTLVGVLLVSLPANLSALAGANAVPVGWLLRALAPWGWRFAALAVVCGAAAAGFVPRGFAPLAAVGTAVGAAYTLLMLPVVWRGPLGVYVRPRVNALAARFRTEKAEGRKRKAEGGRQKAEGGRKPLVSDS
jgi:O-antigen/teichoic acid export membrane protein